MKTAYFLIFPLALCVLLLPPSWFSVACAAVLLLAFVALVTEAARPEYRVRHRGARFGAKNLAISTEGTVVAVSLASAGPFTTVSNTTDIPDPSYTTSDLKVTNLASTQEEYINGLADSAVIKLTGQRVVSDAGQNLLRDHVGAATPAYFKVTFPDGAMLSFPANVKKFSVTGGVNAVEMFDVSVRPTGPGVWSGTNAPT